MELERLVVDNNFEYVQIDTTPDPAPVSAVGQIIWNSDTGALQYGLAGGNVKIDLGLKEVVRCFNSEANTLVKGEVVYIFGAQGDQVAVKRASNTSDTTSAKTLGIVAENITSSGTGYVISHGVIDGINTSAYSAGTILWLGATAGTVTTTKPVAPNHGVFVGVVIKSNAGSGQIFVKPQNGYELDEIHDVLITSPQLGEVLRYDGSLWINNLETGYNNSYAQIIGDGTSNTFVLTHNFNTRDIVVQCRNQNSPYENIEVRWEATTANTATLDFSTIPSSNSVRAIVYASVGAVAPSIFSQTIGDGTSNSYVISHNFNTRDVFVTARNMSSPFEEIEVTWEATTVNSITTYFSTPPSSNSIRVSIHAAGGSSGITSIVGTANEIEVNTASATATIGLPDNVTIGGNLIVTGNLTVSGNTTTLNTTELNVEDNIILLNSGETSTPSLNAGIEVERGTSTNVQIRWNESTDKWQFTNDGSTYKDLGSGGMTISDTAPATPALGDLWYESDSGKTFVYYDSTWVEIGGSAYDSTIGIIQAKGDLLAGTQADGIDRLAVGTDNQRLIANSSANTGLSWASDTYNTLIDAKGDLLVGSADNTMSKVIVGANNTRLIADSSQTSGVRWIDDTQNTVIDAKGDLLVGSANDTVARLAVGTNGHALVADSTATNGLSYSPLNGWRNAIINGDFSVNQRGFTSTTTGATYGFDRWRVLLSGGTVTYSSQAFTAGNAISGQEPTNFARIVTSGQSAAGDLGILEQPIEGVRTFAGQTITISFWAKAASGTPKVAAEIIQNFGTGGSPSAVVNNYVGQVTLSTSWARYSLTFNVPSISGKTLGTSNNDMVNLYLWVSGGSTWNSRNGSLGIQNGTFDFWGVQVEAGSVATPFERRPQQIETALCQRYYVRFAHPATTHICIGMVYPTNNAYATIQLPVRMRTAPTSIVSSGILYGLDAGGVGRGWTAVAMSSGQVDTLGLNFTGGFNLTNGHAVLCAFSTAPSYIEVLGAEL